jgi:colicin import membrane protein
MAANPWLKKLLDPQGYGLAVVLALALHIIVISLFAIQWPEEKREVAEPTPKNIQAKVIQVENKQAKKREEKRRKDENWRKHLAKKKLAREKARKDKALKDKAAKDKAARLADKKKLANQKKLADQKKADDQKKKEQAQKLQQQKLEEQQVFEREQEEALLEALAAEEQQRSIEKALADELQEQKNTAITNDIAGQIRAKISQAWRYPPSARPDMRVEVKIQLVPTGEVVQVSLVTSSGNEALDRSVLAAVKRAQPLPVPQNSRLFEQQFRKFSMGFSPKDAVW